MLLNQRFKGDYVIRESLSIACLPVFFALFRRVPQTYTITVTRNEIANVFRDGNAVFEWQACVATLRKLCEKAFDCVNKAGEAVSLSLICLPTY